MNRVRVEKGMRTKRFYVLFHIHQCSLCQIKRRLVHFKYHVPMLRDDEYHQLHKNCFVFYEV